MSAARYRKKPVVIEAIQYDAEGSNARAVLEFASGACFLESDPVIRTLEGDMTVCPGDFVIKGVQGEFYPCKPDIFAATYDEVTA